MGEARERLMEEALWRFSLAFYALPGISDVLIAWQDRDGLDVNLTLFALWLGVSGRGRLDGEAVAAAERAVYPIRNEIVGPLRSLRRRLKDHPDEDVRLLREDVKALELAAEKLVQARLARLAGPVRADTPLSNRLAAARANLMLYLGADRAAGGEMARICEVLERFAAEGGHA